MVQYVKVFCVESGVIHCDGVHDILDDTLTSLAWWAHYSSRGAADLHRMREINQVFPPKGSLLAMQ